MPPCPRRGLNAAESLHGNFYEGHLTRAHTEFNRSELLPLLAAIWQRIPAEYTSGASFDEWVASDEWAAEYPPPPPL